MSLREEASNNAKGCKTLTVRTPQIENMLASIQIDLAPPELEEVRRFGNALLRAQQAWSAANRSGRRYADRDDSRPLIRREGDRHV